MSEDNYANSAVTAGQFSDFKLVKTRSVAQLVLEVPIEQADAALAALGGLPRPGSEVWVAIARIQETAPAQVQQSQRAVHQEIIRPKLDWWDKPPSQRAALRCQDVRFHKWLADRGRISEETELATVEFVRAYIGGSRSNLGKPEFEQATARWEKFERAYEDHLKELGYPLR